MQIALSFDASLSVDGVRSDVADIGPFEVTVNIPAEQMDRAEFESQIIRETGPALAAITNMILDAGITQRAVEAAHRALLDGTDDDDERDELSAAAEAAADATPPGEIPTGVKSDEQVRQEQNLPLPGEPGHPEEAVPVETEVGGDLPAPPAEEEIVAAEQPDGEPAPDGGTPENE